MALPMPRPISGNRLAPKMTITINRMTISSGNPIRPMVKLLTLLPGQELSPRTPGSRADCNIRRPSRGIIHLVGFLTFIAAVGHAGAAPLQFASGVDLVEVYATVTDARGEPVAGLTAGDFHLFEDGEPQTIAAFAAGEFPLSVAVGIDRSFSMRRWLDQLKTATRAFVSALRPDDRVMVVAIGSETETIAPLSSDHQAAAAAIDRLDAWGTTPLHDAILAAIGAVEHAKGRRALIVASDGVDRYSETTPTMLIGDARRRDVLVYPIAIGGARPPVLVELAAVTGARPSFVKDGRELTAAFASIARELRLQYLLGYSSSHKGSADGEWHSIRVAVDRPDVRVRARDGYVSRR
jgi:Ca-activated chloride channel homolog